MKLETTLFDAPIKVLEEENMVETLKDMLENIEKNDSFFVMDIGEIVEKVNTWKMTMPRVKIFYAVKCNYHPFILKLLSALGIGFDCASKEEIISIINLNVDPSRIIYANPCKSISHLRIAKDYGVDLMTFDSVEELEKVKAEFPKARLVLRIRCDALMAHIPLGMKYGILPEDAHILLKAAKELNLSIVGVSFHVGSGCQQFEVFSRAIHKAREVFDEAKKFGYTLTLLDIGGGFLGDSANSLDNAANYINPALDEHFPDVNEVEVIAEPGRYIATSVFTLVTKILSKKTTKTDGGSPIISYYINDGVYQSFDFLRERVQTVRPDILREVDPEEERYNSTIWGPTCSTVDLVAEDLLLPELNSGDCLYWPDMGAYTIALATKFNGFPIPKVYMIATRNIWKCVNNALKEVKISDNEDVEADLSGSLRSQQMMTRVKFSIFDRRASLGAAFLPSCETCGRKNSATKIFTSSLKNI